MRHGNDWDLTLIWIRRAIPTSGENKLEKLGKSILDFENRFIYYVKW